ncbi:MAG: hypothetical protein LUC44_00725 [Prevotellaceae bacterium]|nr:hypothetical protein [Prevotellaceae bacterium]
MSDYKRINLTPEQEERLRELDVEFEKLCDEQDRLNVDGFAKVFSVLDSIEDGFTPSNPCTENLASIDKALELVGKSDDEAFCSAFKRNNEIILRGRKNRDEAHSILLAGCEHHQQDSAGWQFVEYHFIAPEQTMDEWMEKLQRDAEQGTGLFEVLTDVSDEDEEEDEFLMADKYEINCSLTPFVDDLKRYGVIGNGDNVDGLFPLPKKFKIALLRVLNDIAQFAKDNADKPAKVKNYIIEALRATDGGSWIGLIFQILLLQGLCCWLEGVPFDGNGYIEAQSLWRWLVWILRSKEARFCCLPFGDDDKKLLQPLCDYLYSTKAGRALQDEIFGKGGETHSETIKNPDGTSDPASGQKPPRREKWRTDRAKKYFTKAIDKGFMKQTGDDRYQWIYNNGSKASLAYFLLKVYDPDGVQIMPYKELGEVFHVSRIDASHSQVMSAKHPQRWRKRIDNLFED